MTRDAARWGLIVVVALFVTTAGACEQEMDAGTTVTWTHPTIDPAVGRDGPEAGVDHWHAAFGLWACDGFEQPFRDVNGDALGIHSHDDGLIHIHPTSPEAAGANATLGVFTDEVGIEVEDDSFTLPSGKRFAAADDCNGTPGRVWLIEWPDPADPETHRVREGGFREVRLADGAAYTLAFLARGTDPRTLVPPSAAIDPDDLGASDDADPADTMLKPCADALPAPTPTADQPVEFRPVLQIVPPSDCEAPADLPRDTLGMRFQLGPALPQGMVESATAEVDPASGIWVLPVILNPGRPGIDDLNDIAGPCVGWAPECPTGQLAITQGDLVISAPMIQQPEFERDSIQIYGSLSEEDARILAEALNP